MAQSHLLFEKQGKSESQQGLDSHLCSRTLRQILDAGDEALEPILESRLRYQQCHRQGETGNQPGNRVCGEGCGECVVLIQHRGQECSSAQVWPRETLLGKEGLLQGGETGSAQAEGQQMKEEQGERHQPWD